jgi:cell division septum initiation protein DivIVA
MILKISAIGLLAVTELVLGNALPGIAANQNARVVATENMSGHIAKRRRSSGQMTPQQEQQVTEILKIKTDYDAAQAPLIQEMRAIRSNWQTSNAQKRVLLQQYRPRIEANLQTFEQKMKAYKNHPLYKLMPLSLAREQAYSYTECPDDTATMCF